MIEFVHTELDNPNGQEILILKSSLQEWCNMRKLEKEEWKYKEE